MFMLLFQIETQSPCRSTTSLCSITEETLINGNRICGTGRGMVKVLQGGSLCMTSSSHSASPPSSQREKYHSRDCEHYSQTSKGQFEMLRQDTGQYRNDYGNECKSTNTFKLSSGRSSANPIKIQESHDFMAARRRVGSDFTENPYLMTKHISTAFKGLPPTECFQRDSKEPYLQNDSTQNNNHQQHESNSDELHRPNHKRVASVNTSLISRSVTNTAKFMSWDNLLALAGLQTKDFDSDNLLSHSPDTAHEAHRKASLPNSADINAEAVNYQNLHIKPKKGRSHSFCCDSGSSLFAGTSTFSNANISERSEVLNTIDKENKDLTLKDQDDSVFSNIQTSIVDNEAEKTKAIIRRASIQCETVLTGGRSRNRKIFNPLHEIDVGALRSPGPLHAVTLQYNSMPLNARPRDVETNNLANPIRSRSASVCSLGHGVFSNVMNYKDGLEERSYEGHPSKIHKEKGSTRQSIRQNLQPILENGSKTLPFNFSNPSCKNIDPNAYSNLQVESFGGEDSSTVLYEPESFPKKSNANEYNTLNNTARGESKSPTKFLCPSFQRNQDFDPSLPLNVSDEMENSQPVISKADSNSEVGINETPPCWSPQMTSLPDSSSCISSLESQSIDICPGPQSPAIPNGRPQQTPEESFVLSDDGYSTCDSMGPHSRLSIGISNSSNSSTSDWSSLSSGSMSNVSIASVLFPPSRLSAHKRNPRSRLPRSSHPLDNLRAGVDPKSKSCSTIQSEWWPSCSTVTEGSNSNTASSTSSCEDHPCLSTESTTDCIDECFSCNEYEQQHLNTKSSLYFDENAPNFNSVFANDKTELVDFQTHCEDFSSKVKDPKQSVIIPSSNETGQTMRHNPLSCNVRPKSAISLETMQGNVAVLEKGSIIQFKDSSDSGSSKSPITFSNSVTEGQETSNRHTKRNFGMVKLTPNKGTRQTAV